MTTAAAPTRPNRPHGSPLEEISVEDWNRVIGIDLSGLFYVNKYTAPAIVLAGGGSIVNV